MSEPESRLLPAPGKTAFDYAFAAAKAGSLAFPFFGAGVTLVDLVTAPLRGKRLNDWCEDLRLRFNELSDKVGGLTPEALAKNEAFVSVIAHATQAALRTHQAEKVEALRNAVLNVAVTNALSEDLQLIFVNLLDSFTPTHVRVLKHFHGKDRTNTATFRLQRDLTDQVVSDLSDRGFLQDTRPYAARNRDSGEALVIYDWEVTSLGKQFLEFIKSPDAEKR